MDTSHKKNKQSFLYSLSLFLFADGRVVSQDSSCEPYEFQCLHLNLNQILSINDWNRRPKECIPQSYRYNTFFSSSSQ